MTQQALEQSWFRLQEQSSDQFPVWLAAYREEQRAAFMRHGIPPHKHERWKYADLSILSKKHFMLAGQPLDVPQEAVNSRRVKEEDVVLLVFIDGRFSPQHSDCANLPEGVIALSMKEALARHESLVKEYWHQNINAKDYPFAALTSAVFADGLFLYVPPELQLTQPLQILSLASGQEAAMIAPYNMIVLDEHSSADVIQEYAGDAAGNYFTNAVTAVTLQANAELTIVKLQHEHETALHMENFFIRQYRDSRVDLTQVTTGALFSREDVIVQLAEPGAECVANGFYHASRDGQYIDHHVDIEHIAARTASGMMFKGIADHKSRAVFNGSLHVEKDAQKINAYQENHNLLLSGLAEVYSKPELEIYADDVKCRHGSTTGQIDQDAMFYMRARGIDEESARNILLRGFVEEVLQRIHRSTLRNHAVKQVKFV